MSVDANAESQATLTARGLAVVAPRAGRDILYVLLFAAAAAWAFVAVRGAIDNDTLGFDFEGSLWKAGVAIREGRSPYPEPVLSEVQVGNPAIYPPLLMVLVAPLTALPWGVGLALWTGLLVAALTGSLYALGVRDPRCHALALVSAPAIGSFALGNATLLLLPLVALAWRWRDHWRRTGALLGMAIAAKLFLWPLLFWLVGTRRYRAAACALAVMLVGLLVPWAAIGFDGFGEYPDLLRIANDVYATHSYSVATILGGLGAGSRAASGGALAVAVALGLVALVTGRRGNERASISFAVLAAVLGSPILWSYSLAFLLVPLAIARPRFSALWASLTVFWFVPLLPRERLTVGDLADGGVACCRPEGVPSSIWQFNHSPPRLWPALAFAVLGVGIVLLSLRPTSGNAVRGRARR
jgi:hypothetical protein